MRRQRYILPLALLISLSLLLASCIGEAGGVSEEEKKTDGAYQTDITAFESSAETDETDATDTTDEREEALVYSPSGEEDRVDFNDLTD